VKHSLLFIFGLSSLIAQANPYDKFLSFMNRNGGQQLEINFHQEQYGQKYYASGHFYFFHDQHYIFDSPKEQLEYNEGTVTTVNKMEQQVVYDQVTEGEVTVFDILSGKEEVITVGEIILEKSGYQIPFSIREWDYTGTIRTSPTSGEPKEIILNVGQDAFIKIVIQSMEPLDHNSVPTLDLSTYDIIDLRE